MLINLAFQPLNTKLWNEKGDSISFASDKMWNIYIPTL